MTPKDLLASVRAAIASEMPLPGSGQTTLRHRRLLEVGRQDLSLARLAEAHWDAVAILAEAGREPQPGALYGVWASEIPGQALRLDRDENRFVMTGRKMFCSGAGLIDRALITIGIPEQRLVEVDLQLNLHAVCFDYSEWKTQAFAETQTATGQFDHVRLQSEDLVGDSGWYLARPGFWHGACGPAACWAGGAVGLLDYATRQHRNDPHTLAHLGAMHASVWALQTYLHTAGHEIDNNPGDSSAACTRALTVRHLVEQACTDILQRFARTYGPHPLAMDESIGKRYTELELYLRQSHAERDLESLGRSFRCKR